LWIKNEDMPHSWEDRTCSRSTNSQGRHLWNRAKPTGARPRAMTSVDGRERGLTCGKPNPLLALGAILEPRTAAKYNSLTDLTEPAARHRRPPDLVSDLKPPGCRSLRTRRCRADRPPRGKIRNMRGMIKRTVDKQPSVCPGRRLAGGTSATPFLNRVPDEPYSTEVQQRRRPSRIGRDQTGLADLGRDLTKPGCRQLRIGRLDLSASRTNRDLPPVVLVRATPAESSVWRRRRTPTGMTCALHRRLGPRPTIRWPLNSSRPGSRTGRTGPRTR
jgi:hypothetical protein